MSAALLCICCCLCSQSPVRCGKRAGKPRRGGAQGCATFSCELRLIRDAPYENSRPACEPGGFIAGRAVGRLSFGYFAMPLEDCEKRLLRRQTKSARAQREGTLLQAAKLVDLREDWRSQLQCRPYLSSSRLLQRLALHLRLGLLRQPRGQLVRGRRDFVAQLEVIGEAVLVDIAALDRRAHRAARLASRACSRGTCTARPAPRCRRNRFRPALPRRWA